MSYDWQLVNKINVTETDIKALKVAKKQELQRIKEGWRFYKVNNRLKVLVPFGKDGKPTKQGMRIIEAQNRLLE